MLRRRLMTTTTAAVAALGTPSIATMVRAARAQSVGAAARGASIEAILRPHLERQNLPALAAAVVRSREVVASGAVGTRRAGTEIPVTIEDRFHIGSDTKAMTALLAAMQVEAGALRWDSTPGEVFPDLAAKMDAGFRGVTLEQLLSHTSGMPGETEADMRLLRESYAQEDLNLDELRLWAVARLAARPLAAPPGTRFAYANMGYVVAGAMLERVTGRTWEELAAERIFGPLGLRTAGFGPQASLGRVDAPLGHLRRPDGTLKPMLAGPNGDNPELLGPAGTVHLSVLDFATWAGWNAGEGRRGPELVRPETLRRLHTKVIEMAARPDAQPGTPSRGGYALGWGELTMPFSADSFIFHAGSNGMNLAYALLQPDRDFAMVLVTNVGGTEADQALTGAASDLHREFGARG